MTRRKRFQFVGLFPRTDDSMVGVVLYRGYRFGLTYGKGSTVTPAIVAEDFRRLGTSMFFYGFSPVDAQGVYHNAAWTESFKKNGALAPDAGDEAQRNAESKGGDGR